MQPAHHCSLLRIHLPSMFDGPCQFRSSTGHSSSLREKQPSSRCSVQKPYCRFTNPSVSFCHSQWFQSRQHYDSNKWDFEPSILVERYEGRRVSLLPELFSFCLKEGYWEQNTPTTQVDPSQWPLWDDCRSHIVVTSVLWYSKTIYQKCLPWKTRKPIPMLVY